MSKDYLAHVGVAHDENPPGRGSGRWPYGSGENPNQHQFDFMSEYERWRKRGMTQKEIAKGLLGEDASIADLKAEVAIQRTNKRREDVYKARQLLIECKGNVSEVGRRMGRNEGSIRKLLDKDIEANQDKYLNTAEILKKKVAEKGVIDVGPSSGISLGVTDNTLDVAVAILEKEGYIKAKTQVPQPTGRNKTTLTVLCPPDTDYKNVKEYNGKVSKYIDWKKNPAHTIEDFSSDGGKTYDTLKKPSSLDSSRIMVRYKEDGGALKDGVIELRPGVEDLNLGPSRYAQVRVGVDDGYYMKGMAIYGDPKDFPKGIDVIYNSHQKVGTPLMNGGDGVLKPMKIDSMTNKVDESNPFGALIKRDGQSFYKDPNGKYVKVGNKFIEAKKGDTGERYGLSPINKIREEGEWETWSKTLSSQFLSKQPLKVINQQIKISLAEKRSELNDIMNLTNPAIKQKMLDDFARKCDSNASDLSVRGFKNQSYQVILPVTDMKDDEIYAPAYKDGDTVALIRYPHAGTFEIPILKVNNSHNEPAKKMMQNVTDAVGITPKTAEKMSGADFDGDFVAVIPLTSNRLSIVATEQLEGLKDFDTKSYKLPNDAPKITNRTKQREMGITTNLITDMTVQGATPEEITRVTKHSMVIIDSEKHHLDYKQSAKDNRVAELHKTYQSGGASTIFSRSNASRKIDQRTEIHDKKKMTPEEVKAYEAGKKIFRNTGKLRSETETIKDPRKMTPEELKIYNAGGTVKRYTGNKVLVKQEVPMRATVDDAMKLVHNPNNQKEVAYAKYSNELVALGDEARRASRAIKPVPVDQAAKKAYATEVEQLKRDLRIARSNEPKERVATNLASMRASEKIKANPQWSYEQKGRCRDREMQIARDELGAHKTRIPITDREWEAIQSNALSFTTVKKILDNTNADEFKKRATPKDSKINLTDSKINLIKMLYESGQYTQKDIAEKYGISASTVSKAVKGTL